MITKSNFFQYFQFRGLEDVDKDTRTVVTMTLLGVGLVGTAVFLLLRPTSSWSGSDSTAAGGPYAALKRAFAIFITKDMLLLSVTNFYTGLMLTFWSGVYGPSIANTAVSIWLAYQTFNLGGTFAWFQMRNFIFTGIW